MKVFSKKIISLIIFLFLLLALIIFINVQNPDKLKSYVNKYLWPYTPIKFQVILKIFYDKKYVNQFLNDYNVKFLPNTQFIKLDLKKYNLDFLTNSTGIYNKKTVRKSFYIELVDDNVWIIDNIGSIYSLNKDDNFNDESVIENYDRILSNLKPYQILDTLIIDDKIYFSFVSKNDDCYKFNIFFSEINKNQLNFKNFFTPLECMGSIIQGGRMQKYSHMNKDGLLFTIGDSSTPDFIGGDAQNDSSIYGKIIFKEFSNQDDFTIISKGHRNPQGLFVDNNIVISTEHGPKGGDEINKIVFGKNYGWPIASYGSSYSKKDLKYKKSHEDYGFEEPIFSFVPSIGISEIIEIPENFNEYWKNNFLIASLNGHSLYRVKFSNDFKKVLFHEKIFIGERIRDLKYDFNSKLILIALESKGNLGLIKIK